MSRMYSLETNIQPQRNSARTLIAAFTVSLMAITGLVLGSEPAHAADPSLFGQVTDATSGQPLENVRVQVRDANTADTTWVYTDDNGNYLFGSLPTGNYTIQFRADEIVGGYDGVYATQYYPNTPFLFNADLIALSASSNVEVSYGLLRGGGISGHITASDPGHEFSLQVLAYNRTTSSWQNLGGGTVSGDWEVQYLPPGSYQVYLYDPASPTVYEDEFYDDVTLSMDAELVTVSGGVTTTHIDFELTPEGPDPAVRLAGSNRFATSARIAHSFAESSAVFVANGLDFPDALSAAPAAAYLDAPLLLTQKDSLPSVIRDQIVRLQPDTIYVVGGTGVVSASVYNELSTLTPRIERLWGSNRYATSLDVFKTVWKSKDAPTAFFADGRNYPDALSSAAAAASTGGPVILVNGASSTIPADLSSELGSHSTTDAVLAGGTAVVSAGIETALTSLLGDGNVTRYAGTNRYDTSYKINEAYFIWEDSAYFAVGTGYADALAGAAVAGGGTASPLFLVPGNCIPQDVLDLMVTINVDRYVLLGGTGVLTPAVESLTPCT